MFTNSFRSFLGKKQHLNQKKLNSKYSDEFWRLAILLFFLIGGFLLVLWKLYTLQIIQHAEFQEKAYNTRNTSYSIKAKRGSVFMQDIKTGNIAPVAINTTLYTVFFDARSGLDGNNNKFGADEEDFPIVASELTKILYTQDRYEECKTDITKCPKGSYSTEQKKQEEQDKQDTQEEIIQIKNPTPPTYEKAKEYFEKNILAEFLYKREKMIWTTNVEDQTLQQIENEKVPHLYVSFEKKQVSIDLTGLTDLNRTAISKTLKKYFGGEEKEIFAKLYSKKRGYIPVMTRVYPEEVEKIKELQQRYRNIYAEEKKINTDATKNSPFDSIGFQETPVRFYPEDDLAAEVIGFTDTSRDGQYGIERSMNSILKGQDGFLSASRDTSGNTIEKNDTHTTSVQDGSSVVLTLDRTLQHYAEQLLDEKVKEFEADSGQIIVMNPQNGDILVMANAPRYNPNLYGEIYERRQLTKEDYTEKTIFPSQPIETKDENGNFVLSSYEDFEKAAKRGGYGEYYVYKNRLGPGAYLNKTIMEIYEPGSVMKPLVMAAAMQEGEITKNSTYKETAPIKIGQFTIRNADAKYLGIQTMTNIIERSANVGMVNIAKKMEKALMYQALKTYGFGEYTNIKLPEELSGSLAYWKEWSTAKLFTVSFGQGISVTPLQVVRAWAPLANGGYLVSPRVVSEIHHEDGEIEALLSNKKRIFSEDIVRDMTDILISSTERGVAKNGRVRGHYIAGKTGTSQIIGKNGKYESIEKNADGTYTKGNTITGFIGYAPVKNPKYLIYVKFDRPRKAMRNLAVFGSTTAAPTFASMMSFILDYFNEPKDK